MSKCRLIPFAATPLCVLALATTGARASREVDEPTAEGVGPREPTLSCDNDLTDAQSRAFEDAVMRWELCQQVYVSQPDADDAFYVCFEGPK